MTVPRLNPAGRFDPAALFRPASIAILGAETALGAQMAGNLVLSGFKGRLHLLSQTDEVPAGADLAVLALQAGEVGGAMSRLARAGCFAAIVPGSASDLKAHARRTGVRVLGPHSFGLVVPGAGVNASLSHLLPTAGRLGLVGQSSALMRTVIDWAGPNGVGFSHVVGVGDNADIGYTIVLDWLSRDGGTGAILLDINHIKDHRQFLSAARAAARLRPVVAMRAGLRLLDPTGAADLSFEAALRRAGVLCVSRVEDLLAAAETLSRARPARHDTMAIVTNARGPGRLAADAVLREGLQLLPEHAPDKNALENPASGRAAGDHDVSSQGSPDRGVFVVTSAELAPTAFRFAARTDVGGVLVVHAPVGAVDEAAVAALAAPPTGLRAPILISAMGESTGAPHRATLARAGLPVFATPDQAVSGFRHLVRDRRNREAARELPPSRVLPVDPDLRLVRSCFTHVRREGRLALAQDEALAVLGAYGIPTAPTRCVTTAEDAAIAAGMLGYPVALKLRGNQPPAQRSAASVQLHLRDTEQVTMAARLFSARAQRRGEAADLLVQRQVGHARELAIRVADDWIFGPVISLGAGGTSAHPLDRAVDLPPLNLPLAHALIERCQAGAMLRQNLRDHAAAHAASVAQCLVRVSQLVIDFPEIAALEIPSLFVDPLGVAVADAWLRLRGADDRPGRVAIAPYPAELVAHYNIGGEAFIIRPIRPEDAEAHAAFFSRLSPEDIRYRFFSAMRQLSSEMTVRLTQVDYDREMAFIAVREATAETVGVARLACEAGGTSGEFAVIVQPDMKGRGLASHLMQRLIAWGRSQGLHEIVGQILTDNAPMLRFVRHLGFNVRRMADDPEVMEAHLSLAPGSVAGT